VHLWSLLSPGENLPMEQMGVYRQKDDGNFRLGVNMSRSTKGSKGPGYDFWSRRSGVLGKGPVAKKITKKEERTRTKEIERLALADPESVPGRFPGE